MSAGDRSRVSNFSWVLAGADFIALGRRGVVFLHFLCLLYLHGAKHSLSGRRLGNPRGLVEKWARDPFESR